MFSYSLMERFLHWAVPPLNVFQRAARRLKLAGAAYETLVVLAFVHRANTTPPVSYLIPLAVRHCVITLRFGSKALSSPGSTVAEHQRFLFAQLLIFSVIVAILVSLSGWGYIGALFIGTRILPRAFSAGSDILRQVASLSPLGVSVDFTYLLWVYDMGVGVLTLVFDLVFHVSLFVWHGGRPSIQILIFLARPTYDTVRELLSQVRQFANCISLARILARYRWKPTAADLEYNNICIVCRGTMVSEDAVQLACRHCVHWNCLEQWILRQPTCPTCRVDLRKAYEWIDEHFEEMGGQI
jgi:hypothetical protein